MAKPVALAGSRRGGAFARRRPSGARGMAAVRRFRNGAARAPPSSAAASAAMAVRDRPTAAGLAGKAAVGAARMREPAMTIDFDDAFEPQHQPSATEQVLDDLRLYGPGRWTADDLSAAPPPEPEAVATTVAELFDRLAGVVSETCLERDLDELLWAAVNLFHRAAERVDRKLDQNEQAQRNSQREQDGSEVRSVELERLLAEGGELLQRRSALELFRDEAAGCFERLTHSAWRPHAGSLVSHRRLTAAVIDSRDFIAARRRADTELLTPPGPKVAFSGGADFNDHRLIWDRLDRVLAKHPDMVLLHGGSPKGAERIAACWADNRNIPQIAFRPDWTRHAKAAPFRRNDQMLEALPIGVMIAAGSGIQDNLADKARKLGLPVWRIGGG